MKPLGLAIFLGLFWFYLYHAAPSVTTGDSGEFMTGIATLSLPHAPSFPLYTLAGKCFVSLIPFGSVPLRCNIFSAFTSAGAGVILFLIGVELGAGMLISVLTTLLIAVTASFWENSLVTEVFSLNALFFSAVVLCLIKRQTALAVFLLGLGLGNHQILLFVAPAILIALAQEKTDPRQLPALFFVFAIGLSIYMTLPIRSMKNPPMNWGQPTSIEKLYRTITRKDYGSLKLSVGDAPERNAANAVMHVKTFIKHMNSEVPWPAVLLGLAGLLWGLFKRERSAFYLGAIFLASGPFFFWLGNLPFDAQSDGIVGRFMIMPVIALTLCIVYIFKDRRWIGAGLLSLAIFFTFQRGHAEALANRSTMLTLDYGRAMLRTLPMNAALYMDGGDDAFYSLAMLHNIMGRRPDVDLHDRGGLVFKNPYGPDFRSLTREQKQARRLEVERTVLSQRPLLYSTMDSNVLPGIQTDQSGFLIETNEKSGIDWSILILRSLYPLQPDIYRMRALGCFFPFMRGRQLLHDGRMDDALQFFRRAQRMGHDVDWLSNNLGAEYAKAGYQMLMSNQFVLSEKIYRQWLDLDPMSMQAQSNLGVVLERSGRIQEAKVQYEKTAGLFPQAVDPVFNLAVLSWKMGDWPQVVTYLEEVLRRKPDHLQAQGYLKAAREKMGRR